MDDRAARITRAPCHLPKEAQGIESRAADRRALHLDRAQLKAIAVIADNPERGLLLLPSILVELSLCGGTYRNGQVLTSTILEQVFEIEYLVQHGQCPDCAKLAAKNTWKALVQVRQKVPHKRTFLYLEQLILKHGAQKDTISLKEVKDGLDFFYSQRSHGIKMVEFLSSVVPIR